jgi:hypothetical protein
MPEAKTLKKMKQDRRTGKSPSTQAGEFVREEIHHVREGKHGARNPKQAIAIGLSKARKAGVKLPPRQKSDHPSPSRKRPQNRPSARRSQAIQGVLKQEPRRSTSHRALSKNAEQTASQRGPVARRKSALKAVQTKGPAVRRQAAKKAARTRKAA